MKLSKTALSVLADADREINPTHQIVLADLVSQKLATDDGKLTPMGISASVKLKHRLDQLKDGVPFADRKFSEPDFIAEIGAWVRGKYKGTLYITNSEMLVFASPPKSMGKLEYMPKDTQEAISRKLRSTYAAIGRPANSVEMFPVTWRVLENFNVHDLMDFESKDKTRRITVNAAYYDFVCSKYTSTSFWVSAKDAESPLAVKISNRKTINGIVAVIAGVKIA